MTLAIMQPYLFPYLGYWQLIANSDQFIFFDVVQYNKRSWMNRNRILHPNVDESFQYISVPIKKNAESILIKDMLIQNEEQWKEKILGQLTVYKKLRAPYYHETVALVELIFDKNYRDFLSLCIESTKEICLHLDIEFNFKVASKIEFDRSAIGKPGDWALAICQHLDVKKYINPHGGFEIFDENKYNHHGVDIKFIKSNLTSYKQSRREEFTPGLSIIDVLMFNEKEVVKRLLKSDFQELHRNELVNL
jgi:hypothetical protein